MKRDEPSDDIEREERIALVADGCNITQEEAEIKVAKMEADQAKAKSS